MYSIGKIKEAGRRPIVTTDYAESVNILELHKSES